MTQTELTADQQQRYARNLAMVGFDVQTQLRLRNSTVAVVGVGGLGSPVALYLAASGVGQLVLIDDDVVELSNLQRQILHGETRVGTPKVDSAHDRLLELDGSVTCSLVGSRLVEETLESLSGADVVVDCCDNYRTRYLVAEWCAQHEVPHVWAAVNGLEGQLAFFHPAVGGPCYRCVFPEAPPPSLVPEAHQRGILGATCGVVGSWQAVETLKWLTGLGESATHRLLCFDLGCSEVKVRKTIQRPSCCCSKRTGKS